VKPRSTPPDEKGARYDRESQGALGAADADDLAQRFEMPLGLTQKRLFRQSVSAGFRTQVAAGDEDRLVARAGQPRSQD
jgi:hypothetical protein